MLLTTTLGLVQYSSGLGRGSKLCSFFLAPDIEFCRMKDTTFTRRIVRKILLCGN